ncbi:MAG: protein kinase domain-containing protein [Planctomycetota bacterium]
MACWVVAGETQEAAGASTAPDGQGDATRHGSTRLEQGVELGGYRILDELGRGGMAVVYRATQPGLEREVALKILRTSDTTPAQHIERFLREGQAAARLSHPNVVPVFDVGEADGAYFLAMEFVRGRTLDAHVQDEAVEWRTAVAWVRDVARALHYAHEQGVVHRDVKPANVLVTEGGVPRIADFGLARLDDGGGITAEGTAIGTPSYMAPEQAAGERDRVGPATDVYAAGAVLYECLSGQPPFTGGSVLEILRAVQMEEPRPLRSATGGLPRDLVSVVEKCLEKEPGDRYPSAEALAQDLDRVLRGEPVAARPRGAVTKLGRHMRRKPALLVAGLSVAAAAAVAGWALWYASRPAPTSRGGGAGAGADPETVRRTAAQPHYDLAVARFDDHETRRRAGDAKAAFTALEEATEAIEKALSKDPAFAEAYLVRARIRRQHRHLAGALADYDRAVSLDPGLTDAYYERVRLRFDHDFATLVGLGGSDPVETAAILEDLNRIADEEGMPERRFVTTAMVHLLGGRYRTAEQWATRAITDHRDSADAYSVRAIARTAYGVIASGTGRTAQGTTALQNGLADFDAALKLGADPVGISPGRSQVLAGLGRIDEALAEINQTIEFDNSDHLAILLRARLRMLNGQRAQAEADLAAAVDLAGETAELRVARALVRLVPALTQAGTFLTKAPEPAVEQDIERAMDDLNWVAAHAPTYHIARFYRAIGHLARLQSDRALLVVVGADLQFFHEATPEGSEIRDAAGTWLRTLRGLGLGDASTDAKRLWDAVAAVRAADTSLAAGKLRDAADQYRGVVTALEGYDPALPVDRLVAWRRELTAAVRQRAERGAARALAGLGEVHAALGALEAAVEAGYQDVSQMERDRAFANLREQPRFRVAISRMRDSK